MINDNKQARDVHSNVYIGQIGQRITHMISYYCNGNKAEFARMMDEKPQTVSSWISRDVGKSVVNKIISKFPDVNATWLLTGEGNMLNNEQNRKEGNEVNTLLEGFDQKDPTVGYLLKVIEALADQGKMNAEANKMNAEANQKHASANEKNSETINKMVDILEKMLLKEKAG